jgi:hypothetical protein
MDHHGALPGRGIDMNGTSAQVLRDVIDVLTEQRKILTAQGAHFAARLIDFAIMELRLGVNDISEHELSAFCDYLAIDPVGRDSVN